MSSHGRDKGGALVGGGVLGFAAAIAQQLREPYRQIVSITAPVAASIWAIVWPYLQARIERWWRARELLKSIPVLEAWIAKEEHALIGAPASPAQKKRAVALETAQSALAARRYEWLQVTANITPVQDDVASGRRKARSR